MDESLHAESDQNSLEARLKSRSLPSYAKPGGEGLDYRAIFAVLEREEERLRKRRPSFRKREGGKPNYFCFPLLNAKGRCKETSLSSDTSCSSLEFHRPRSREILLKGWQKKEESANKDRNVPKTIEMPNARVRKSPDRLLLPPDPAGGSTVGSSDSMEKSIATGRSSRTSTDSLSKKEKLDAVKARVEAAREKYCDSSSEEELKRLSRHNSNDVLNRPQRDLKSRSARTERYWKRKSQEETSIKRGAKYGEQSDTYGRTEDSFGKPPVGSTKNIRGSEHDVHFRKDATKGSSFSLHEHLFPNSQADAVRDFGQYLRKDYCENVYQPIESCYTSREANPWKVSHVNSLPTVSKSHALPSRQTIPLIQKTKSFHETKSPDTKYHMLTVATATPSAAESNFRGILHPRPSPRDSGISSMASTSSVTRAPTPPPRSPHSKSIVNEAYQQMRNISSPTFRAAPWTESHSLERQRVTGSPRYSSSFICGNGDNGAYHKLMVGGETVSSNGSDASQKIPRHLLLDPWADTSQCPLSLHKDGQDIGNDACFGDHIFETENAPSSSFNRNSDFDSFLAQLSSSRNRVPSYPSSSGAYMSDSQVNPEKNTRFWRGYYGDVSNNDMDSSVKWRCLPRKKPVFPNSSSNKCGPYFADKENTSCISESLMGILRSHGNSVQASQSEDHSASSNSIYGSLLKPGVIGQRIPGQVDSSTSLPENKAQGETFQRRRLLNSPTQVPKRLSAFRSFVDDTDDPNVMSNKATSMTFQEKEKRCSESLENAMAELEKVYRSLKLSDDDLLGKNEKKNITCQESKARDKDLNPFLLSKSSSSSDSLTLSPPSKTTSYPSYRIPSANLKPALKNNILESRKLFSSKEFPVQEKLPTNKSSPTKNGFSHDHYSNMNLENKKMGTKMDNFQPNSSINIDELFKDLTQSVQMDFETILGTQVKEKINSSIICPKQSLEISKYLHDDNGFTYTSRHHDPFGNTGLKRSNSQHSDKENIPGDQQAKDSSAGKGHWVGGRKRRAVRSHSANFAHLLKSEETKDVMLEMERAQSMSDIIAALEKESKTDNLPLSIGKRKGSFNSTVLNNSNRNETQKVLTKSDFYCKESSLTSRNSFDARTEEQGMVSSDLYNSPTPEKNEIWQVRVSVGPKSKATLPDKEPKSQSQLHNALMRSMSSPPLRLRTPRHPDTWSDTEVRPNKVTPFDESQLEELLLSLDREAKALTRATPTKGSRTSLLSGPATDAHVGNREGEMHGLEVQA